MLSFISYVCKPYLRQKSKFLFPVTEDTNGMNKCWINGGVYLHDSAYVRTCNKNDKRKKTKPPLTETTKQRERPADRYSISHPTDKQTCRQSVDWKTDRQKDRQTDSCFKSFKQLFLTNKVNYYSQIFNPKFTLRTNFLFSPKSPKSRVFCSYMLPCITFVLYCTLENKMVN